MKLHPTCKKMLIEEWLVSIYFLEKEANNQVFIFIVRDGKLFKVKNDQSYDQRWSLHSNSRISCEIASNMQEDFNRGGIEALWLNFFLRGKWQGTFQLANYLEVKNDSYEPKWSLYSKSRIFCKIVSNMQEDVNRGWIQILWQINRYFIF